jgi:hypothetical protein
MRPKYFLIFAVFTILATNALAQKQCGNTVLQEEKKILNPQLYKQQEDFRKDVTKIVEAKKQNSKISAVGDIYTIPVIVHVVHNNSGGIIGGAGNSNITDAQVYSQIQVLNEDFRKKAGTNGFNTNPVGADTEIEFCLATTDPDGNLTSGILRTYNSKSFFRVTYSDEILLKSLSYWPSDQYLNIWVTRLENGYLGYAQYPSGGAVTGLPSDQGAATDGLVIDYRSFGNTGVATAPYGLGRTATHEVGHWLGLIHTWGDSNCGNDHVGDTPIDKGPNDDLDCADSSNCIIPAVYVQDMTNNYLDYSVDACMNIFTEGQKLRMRTVMETAPRRLSLLSSKGCCISASVAAIPFEDDFETGSHLSKGWAIENPDSNVTWTINNNGGFGNSSFSMFMQNDSANLNELDHLLTPFLNFNMIEPFLEFDLAYAQDPSLSSDTLVVSYYANCTTWVPLLTLYGSSLITTSTITSDFTPGSNDWRRIKLDLDALNNISATRIRFENHSAIKSNLYIDNINIYKTSPSLTVNPYPNPAREILSLEIIFKEEADVKLELYDMIGQKLFEINDPKQVSYIKTLDVSGITRGMYLLKVSTEKEKVTKRVLLNF